MVVGSFVNSLDVSQIPQGVPQAEHHEKGECLYPGGEMVTSLDLLA